MSRSNLSIFLLLLVACGPLVGGGDEASTDGEAASTSLTGPSATSSSSVSTSSPPSTTGDDTTTGEPPDPSTSDSSSSSGGDDVNFIELPDFEGGSCGVAPEGTLHHCSQCDVWAQDCPEGEKCMPWSNDGSDTWNAPRCSPILDDAGDPGEPCTVEGGPASGVDTCRVSAMCWNVDPKTLTGECVQFCEGSEDNPICPASETGCMIANDGNLALCLPTCDPLEVGACGSDQSCHPIDATWFCLPNGAPVYDGSLTPTLCGPGTTAVDPTRLAGCDPELCCAQICDTTASACAPPLQCVAIGDGPAGVCVD